MSDGTGGRVGAPVPGFWWRRQHGHVATAASRSIVQKPVLTVFADCAPISCPLREGGGSVAP